MKKEFIKKMIKAEILRYQAIKEILPEHVKGRVNSFEKDAEKLLKDIAYELVAENFLGQNSSNQTTTDTAGISEAEKSVKRVQVDFN